MLFGEDRRRETRIDRRGAAESRLGGLRRAGRGAIDPLGMQVVSLRWDSANALSDCSEAASPDGK